MKININDDTQDGEMEETRDLNIKSVPFLKKANIYY